MTFVKPPVFNVKDYGALGNNTDDTTAFQAAITAALAAGKRATLLIPAPVVGKQYYLTGTLTIQPVTTPPQTQCFLNIECLGNYDAILWLGGSGTAATPKNIFSTIGWKRSTIRNMHVVVNGQNYVNVWDIDTTTPNYSSGQLLFENCHAYFYGSTNNIGWRLGHDSPGIADISALTFISCTVTGDSATTAAANTAGHQGWVNEDVNGLNYIFIDCAGVGIQKFFTTLSVAAASPFWPNGGSSHYFYGCGGGYCYIAYEFTTGGGYHIHGGRWEHGDILINAGGSGSSSTTISLDGVSAAACTPGSNHLIMLGTLLGATSAQLKMTNCVLSPVSGVFTAADLIDAQVNTPGVVSLYLSSNMLMATTPLYTTAGTGQIVADIRPTNVLQNSSHAVTGLAESTQPIKEGIRSGVATLVGGTVTVTTTAVATTSRIRLSPQNSSGTAGELTVSARTAATSFVITSLSGTDTRQVFWEIVDPF